MAPADAPARLATQRLTALFGRTVAVREISLLFPAHTVTAIIGPSGCGKSTFLRCLNRMHELSESGWVTGSVLLDNVDIYGGSVDPVAVRRRIGMVFQRPTPFPTMSIHDNVAAGLRVNGRLPAAAVTVAVERALVQAKQFGGPVLVHCLTRKGNGFKAAEDHEEDRFHAVGKIDADP